MNLSRGFYIHLAILFPFSCRPLSLAFIMSFMGCFGCFLCEFITNLLGFFPLSNAELFPVSQCTFFLFGRLPAIVLGVACRLALSHTFRAFSQMNKYAKYEGRKRFFSPVWTVRQCRRCLDHFLFRLRRSKSAADIFFVALSGTPNFQDR